MFMVFSFVLPILDIALDSKTGVDLHKRGHKKWARATLALPFAPFAVHLLEDSFKKVVKGIEINRIVTLSYLPFVAPLM